MKGPMTEKKPEEVFTLKNKALLATLAVSVMLLIGGAVPVYATDAYTPVQGGTVTLHHILDMDTQATTVHNAQFTFAVAGSAEKAAGDPDYVYAGPAGAAVTGSPLVYSDTDVSSAATEGAPTGKKRATKDITVNLSGVNFTDVGIYRYAVTETLPTGPFEATDGTTRYIDVNIIDNNGALQIDSYVVRTVADTASNQKSDNFSTAFSANTLTVSKNVAGNQGSKNKYFKFTVALTKAGQEEITDTTPIAVSGHDTTVSAVTSATGYTVEAINAANHVSTITCADLAAGHDFYLKHGQALILTDIPKGYGYTVTEVQEEYTPSVVVTGDTSCTKSSTNVADSELTAYTTLAFTNTRRADVSTGVMLAVAVPALLLLTGVVGAGVILSRKRRRQQ